MARSTRPIIQDDIFQARYVVGGALSPDGASAVYVLSETLGKGDEERQATSLWQVSTRGGRSRRLTGEAGDDSNPRFAPDGRSVYFLSTRSNVPQIYRIALDGGEADRLTDLPQGVGAFDLSPDGKTLAFSALAAPPPPPGPNDHKRIARAWFRMDGMGYLQDLGQALYLMPSRGGKAKAVTEHDGVILGLAWSPNGSRIACLVTGMAHHEFMQGRLRIVEVAGGKQETLADGQVIMNFFWCNDEKLGYLAPPAGNLSRQSQLFVIGVKGKRARSRTEGSGLAVGALFQVNSPAARTMARPVVAADGATVCLPVAVGGESRIYRFSISGARRYEEVLGGERIVTTLDGNNRHLLLAVQSPDTPPELALFDLDSGAERALTGHNRRWRTKIRWPELERVTAQVSRGIEVEGWVLKPPGATPPYKTILYIHGGPHAGFGLSFNADFQELAGAGYALAFCNPRGSTGYGDAFSTAIIGRWGKLEHKDFDAFLDALVEAGIADPDRLGVTGVSGGGHLSAWLIGNSRRFKAAVPEQGVYNMFSMWGVSDAGRHLIALEMDGEPHRIPERYWELSPLAHAHKCRTPTLLIQGEDDLRCPMQQAEELFTAMEHAGCRVELLRLNNCPHGMELAGPPPLRRYRMNAMLEWFDAHIE